MNRLLSSLHLQALQQGTWVKLICGASFHHLASIHNLALVYTLAGVNCIDVAADPAILRAAQLGITAAQHYRTCPIPWLMASFNDGEDPHFRKAVMPQDPCPVSCSQPCLTSCPPHAIQLLAQDRVTPRIQADLCYGCGRCEPVCPYHLIELQGYQVKAAGVMPELMTTGIQALEIHTQVGRREAFSVLWYQLQPWIQSLQLVSISVGDHPELASYLWSLVECMDPVPPLLVWQVDGRPMSGDIGAGTAKASIRLAQKVLMMGLPGIVQLAGGTNQATVSLLDPSLAIGGVAYGSYARQLVTAAIEQPHLLHDLEDLDRAVGLAQELVQSVRERTVVAKPKLITVVD